MSRTYLQIIWKIQLDIKNKITKKNYNQSHYSGIITINILIVFLSITKILCCL